MTGIGEGGGTESVENGNGNAEGGSEYSADYDGIYIQFKDWMDRDGLNLNTLNRARRRSMSVFTLMYIIQDY